MQKTLPLIISGGILSAAFLLIDDEAADSSKSAISSGETGQVSPPGERSRRDSIPSREKKTDPTLASLGMLWEPVAANSEEALRSSMSIQREAFEPIRSANKGD